VVFLIRILILILLFFSKELYSENIEKIILSINDNIYTTIDLDKRLKYLKLLTNNQTNFSELEYLDDFISVLLFNAYAHENNITVDKELLNEYLEKIINQYKEIDPEKYEKLNNNLLLGKKEILFQIKYDYQRKLILQNILNEINLENLNQNEIEVLNLFNIQLIYFSLNLNHNTNINKIINMIDFNNINNTLNNLDENKIDYNYYSKKINSFKKLNKKIKNEILQNNDNFLIEEDDHILIGKIEKIIKDNIDLKYTFFQLISDSGIDKKLIKCENINHLNNSNGIKIKKFNKIEFHKINNIIQKNLKSINDFISFKENDRDVYIILCEFDYDKNITQQIILNEKINEEVRNIENEFILQKQIDYNLKLYE